MHAEVGVAFQKYKNKVGMIIVKVCKFTKPYPYMDGALYIYLHYYKTSKM